MNFRTRNWTDRFGHLCADNDSGDSGGGGGEAVDTGDADAGDSGGSADSGDELSGSQDSTSQIDLNSTDPAVIHKFPKGHKLNDDQLKALMSYNPKKKVEPVKAVGEQQQQPDPVKKPAAQAAPANPSFKDGYSFNPKLNRWFKDGKMTAAPKDAAKRLASFKAPAQPAPGGKQQQPAPKPEPDRIDKLAGVVEKLVQGQQPGQQQPGSGAPQEPPPFFGGATGALVVPDTMMEAILGDDPAQAKAGVEAMLNGMANVVMKHVFSVMQYQQQQIMRQVPGAVHSYQTQRQNSNDFYERYPELNKPALHGVVNTIGQKVGREWQAQNRSFLNNGTISPEFFDEIARRFEEETGYPLSTAGHQRGNEAQSPQPQPKPKKSAFFNRGSQARPSAASAQAQKSAEIMGVVTQR